MKRLTNDFPKLSMRSLWPFLVGHSGLANMARHFNGWQRLLLAGWVLAMISLPLIRFGWGDGPLTWGVNLAVCLQAVLVLSLLRTAWGGRRTAASAGAVIGLTWAAEAVGTATGWPFGAYEYTAKLQPQLGHVPLLVPLAWLMMLPPAWVIAAQFTGRWGGLRFVALSALALTAWDLFLDPQMVAWGFWRWTEPGGYFGIPWLNYAGWLLTAAVITLLVRPGPLPFYPFFVIYSITWILESIGLIVFWGLIGPGLVGFLVMGYFILIAWAAARQER